ncbi:T9SS type B sorting domain-containing protein [Winogradskyella aurantiaca]|uniref:T9SS type B sorting domain-containing protein n=1 Tax=Winogradskyella aurantiaca TaxID=2219558 RepID=UPI000E1CF3C5|nr:T9SS type B sorting domain-containing protein [Winogradskyella aurantiaca]
MNKPTFKAIISLVILLVTVFQAKGQNYEPFTPRFNQDVKGDIILIGNNILGPDNNAFNDLSVYNHNVDMQYIDIDTDASTFSSSSADLTIPNPNCYRIIYAGLYWGAVNPGDEPITDIKFKGPEGGYVDIQGTVIYDANGSSVDGGNSFSYACFADVTNIVTGFNNDLGTYTVANVSSAQGESATYDPYNGTGESAGWSLFIVFEDPTLPGKSITSFDGFSAISVAGNNPTLDIPVDGFRTVPAPAPVRANFAFATLEGDSPILGDQLKLNGLNLSTADRPETNFFNSSVTQLSALPVDDRAPNSANTLGFDTGVIAVPNPGNTVIANDATSATITLETEGDTYFPYFFAFAVDIIEPDIVLTKIVEDETGTDIGGQEVGLNQPLNYVISFQNVGNDNATNFQIRDILPINIIYDHPNDLVLPDGVTVSSYNPVTRELIFAIDDSLVEENDPLYSIRIEAQTVETCQQLADACSNIINNQAFATYNGFYNPNFQITDDPSLNSNTGCLISPQATNFLADLDDCVFSEEIILCGDSVSITAADGYDSYSWSNSSTGSPVLGTGQTFTVTSPGTYYSFNTAIAPCQSIVQEFDVITFGAGVTNPLIPFADQVVVCPNDGKELPYIFLCGANDIRSIATGITDTTSMIWEQLDETSCPAVLNSQCANEDGACTWNQVGTGPDFTIDTSGQFRLTLNYEGGCFNQFYFNVYQNLLNPNATSRDIYCDTLGEIAVGGVPSGYEYSLDGLSYQSSPIFPISVAGLYTVYIRQIGVLNSPCVFTVPDIQILDKDFSMSSTVEQPLCYNDFGSIYLAANEVRPQYFFSIYQGATLVNSVGPINENDYTFQNLSPGIYTVNVSTEDGCMANEDIEIIQPPTLDATMAITEPLNCTDGELTVYAQGGTPPYFYFVNGNGDFQTDPIIQVSTAGTYSVEVVDANNCSTVTSIAIDPILPPEYTISSTNLDCSGSPIGTISINVTNANGNSLQFSIDGGLTFVDSNVFTGLSAGDYEVIVQSSIDGSFCDSNTDIITIGIPDPITAAIDLTSSYSCLTDGVISVSSVSGGSAPYSYSLDGVNFQAGTIFSGLNAGFYEVWVQDATGCAQIVGDITLDPLDPPTDMEFSNSPLLCPSNTIDLTVTNTVGGVAPLEYQITSPSGYATSYQSSNIFTGLVPGTYSIQVRDANDCTYIESYTILPLPELSASSVLNKSLDCSVSPDAVIDGAITGGSSPYTYAVSVNGGTYTNLGTTGSTFSYTSSGSGTYQFEITDSNGCIATTQTVVIDVLEQVTLSIDAQDPNCTDDSNGVIVLNTLTGQAPFEYSLDGGSTFVSTNIFSGLDANTYNYIVRDANQCEASGSIVLNNPTPIDASIVSNPIQCNSNIPGSIDVTINSGGVSPFNYTILDAAFNPINSSNNNSNTSHTFNNLNFGDYYISIVDANGCEFLSNLLRIETPPNISLLGNTSSGTCIAGANVEIEVVSGVGPFIYMIYGQPATTVGPTPNTTQTFTGLDHGVTYQFQVEDAGGCFSIIEVTTPVLSPIDVSANTITDVSCFGSMDGAVDFTITNYDPSVTSITYEILDGLSNTSLVPAVTGTANGLSGSNISASLGGLAAGTYTLMIREDDGTQCTTSLPFVIRQPIQALLAAVSGTVNANCLNDALVTISANGGTAPYNYAVGLPGFSPVPADFSNQNTLLVDPMVSTDWDIVVMDANGCEVRLNQSVNSDPEPQFALTTLDNCLVNDGEFEVEVSLVSSGVGPYQISLDSGAFVNVTLPYIISDLNSGSHSVEIRDANGCTNLQSIDIDVPLEFIPEVTNRTTCNNDDGIIVVTTNGGSGNYSYTISPANPSITISANVFSGVPSGVYTININDLDTGCTSFTEIVMPEAQDPAIQLNPNPVSCFAGLDGSLELSVSGYSGTYIYELYDSSNASILGPVSVSTTTNPQLISGLEAGTYQVVMTETQSPFCSTNETVIISSPPSAVILNLQETSSVSCYNDSGTIVAIASGGTTDYEYELSGPVSAPYSANGTFSNLTSGTYTVTVRDAQGCTATDQITLNVPPAISADVAANSNLLSCYNDDNGVVEITNVTGGQGSNYSYTLNMLSPTISSSGPQTTPVFSNLSAGTYQVLVSDAYNCVYQSIDIVIDQPNQLMSNLIVSRGQTCSTDTELTLSATGGTGTYEYSNDASFSNVLGTFSNSVSFDATPGTYQYFVRDANGCVASASNEITIDELVPLQVVLDTTNSAVNCAGDSTGAIIATAEGGLGNYTYELQDAAGNAISAGTIAAPGVFTELPAGIYQIYVSSGDCQTVSIPVDIQEPDNALVANTNVSNITCSGLNDGIIEITANGGTGIIKYAISPQLDQFFDEPVFDNLEPGDYQIIVQDELGCFELLDATIVNPEPVILSIVPNSIFPEICSGDENGEFSIEISGGSLPYSVSLDNPDGPFLTGAPTQTEFDFTDLAGGDHLVYVMDAAGCTSEWNITFPEPAIINPLVDVVINCDNNSVGNIVTVSLENSNVDMSELDFSLNGGPFQTDPVFTNVGIGRDQYIDIRHTNGCVQSTPFFNIDEIMPLEIALEEGDTNEIIASVEGGSGIYEYYLNGESYGSTNTFIVYESGVYTVSVRDSYGCEVSATISIEYVDICIPNYFTPNGDNVQDEWGPGCASQYQNLEFDIFDRYGRKVASLNVNQKWDGTYDGRELPTGDYWYVVRLNDSNDDRDFVGHFTLYR